MNQPIGSADIPNLVRYQRDQLTRFRSSLERAIAADDVEAVHDLRVASRRLHDGLDAMAPWAGHKRVRQCQRALRKVRRSFRRIRDIDVLRGSLREAPPSDPPDAETRAYVDGILARRRAEAMARAQRVGQRAALARAIEMMGDITSGFSRSAAKEPMVLAQQMVQSFRQRAVAVLAQDPQDESTDLHGVRIRVKRARYCAQLLDEAACLDLADLLNDLTEMQRLLGHWNDQIVAARILSRLAGRWRNLTAQTRRAETLFECAAARARLAQEDRRRVVERWPAFAAAVRGAVPAAETVGEPPAGTEGTDANA